MSRLYVIIAALFIVIGLQPGARADECYETAGRYCPTPQPTDQFVCGPNGEQYRPWAYCGESQTPYYLITPTIYTPVPTATSTPSPTQSLCYQTGGRFGC